MSKHVCPKCNREFERSIMIGKAVVGIAGLFAGRKAPTQAAILTSAGIAIGHAIDKYLETQIDPKCPTCNFVIRIVAQQVAQGW